LQKENEKGSKIYKINLHENDIFIFRESRQYLKGKERTVSTLVPLTLEN
jgi:hypothetical protein